MERLLQDIPVQSAFISKGCLGDWSHLSSGRQQLAGHIYELKARDHFLFLVSHFAHEGSRTGRNGIEYKLDLITRFFWKAGRWSRSWS